VEEFHERADQYKERPEEFHAFQLHSLAWLLRWATTLILLMGTFLLFALVDPQDIQIPRPVRQVVMFISLLGMMLSLLSFQWHWRRALDMAHAIHWVSAHGWPEESASEAQSEPDTTKPV
jgi:hypothetical protein